VALYKKNIKILKIIKKKKFKKKRERRGVAEPSPLATMGVAEPPHHGKKKKKKKKKRVLALGVAEPPSWPMWPQGPKPIFYLFIYLFSAMGWLNHPPWVGSATLDQLSHPFGQTFGEYKYTYTPKHYNSLNQTS
jgi:hypothetical protein